MSEAPSPLRPTEGDALAEWRRLVAADAEQVTRLREHERERDHYRPTAARFRAGGALPAGELPLLEAIIEAGETLLDIGAGGGRFAVPLARRAGRVIVIEPSEAMRANLVGSAAEAGVTTIELHDQRWPDPAWSESTDVSLASHVLYDISEVGAFLDAMERHSRRLCVVALGETARGAQLAALWQAVHGEPLQTLPALRELLALLGARRRRYELRIAVTPPAEPSDAEQAFELARRLLWLAGGSEKEARMRELVREWYGEPDGRVRLPAMRDFVGVVSWTQRSAGL
jgi:2-polyprenyl-3-methyl-5-hydroxy-6-metoxy-1,4-benzoquinol methylase